MKKTNYISLLDSFGTFYQKSKGVEWGCPNEATQKSWQFTLLKKLGISHDKIEPLSQNGSCIDYIQYCLEYFIDKKLDYLKDSLIIVGVPDPNRIWFSEYPSISHIANLSSPMFRQSFIAYAKAHGSDFVKLENQMKAAYDFAMHGCFPEKLAFLKAKSFITYIKYIKQKYDLKIYVLPISDSEDSIGIQFNDFKTKGCLAEVQAMEMAGANSKKRKKLNAYLLSPMSPWVGSDGRINHMMLENHDILAEKLYHSITTGEDLDLTTGFITNVITKQNCLDYRTITQRNHKLPEDAIVDNVYHNIIQGPF